jgi:glycosyltransferase involved in cell wall biosynthesis
MKRVLILIKGLGRGGAEQLVVSSLRHFDRDRVACEVAYLLPWKDALVNDLREMGIPVHCLDGAHGAGWALRLRSLVRQRRIDIVHAHSPVAAIVTRIALGPGRPAIVYTEHNMWSRYHGATRWGNLLTYPLNDHVFAVSNEVLRSIRFPRGLGFLAMLPTETLYHGIDPGAVAGWASTDGVRVELGIPADAPFVVTVANFKAHKGHSSLLEAADIVRRSVPDVRFVLVGTGRLEDEIRRQTTELDLDGTVLIAGFRDDAPRIVNGADIFVLPSIQEGLPIALLEAMALEKPVVATAVGGTKEVVEDGTNGLLVPPKEPAALAGRILSLLETPSLRRSLGEAAGRRALDFDIRGAVRRMEQVYEELVT